mgnify:CR=1 FL=1
MNTQLPCEITTYIDTIIHHARCNQDDKNAIRQELTQHFEEIYANVTAPNAQELIQEFGNPKDLAKLMTRGKCRVQNNTALNTSGLYGLSIFLFLLFCAIVLGGRILPFINLPGLVLSIALPVCLGVSSYGPTCFKTLWKLRLIFYTPAIHETQNSDIKILKGLIQLSYASAAMSALVGSIHLLYQYNPLHVSQSLDEMILNHYGIVFLVQFILLSLLYALILAEVILRPAIKRIQFHLNKTNKETSIHTDRIASLSKI